MRTRIELLAQPKSMRSIIDATRRERWHGLAWNWCVIRGGVPAAPHSHQNPTPSPCCAFSGAEVADRGAQRWSKPPRRTFRSNQGGKVEQVEQICRNKYNIYNSLFYNVYYGIIGKRCFTAGWRCVSYMEIAPLAPLLHLWPARIVSRSCSKSSTLRRESWKRTYCITASRMT